MDVSGEIHRAHFAELVLDELHGDFERRAVGDWRAGSRRIGGRRALASIALSSASLAPACLSAVSASAEVSNLPGLRK